MLVRFDSLHRTLELLARNAVAGLSNVERGIGVINTLPFPRTRVLTLDGARPTLVQLEGFAARTVQLAPAEPAEARPGDRIENDRFRVQAAPDGTLTIEDLGSGTLLNGLHALEDEPDVGDLYNFCPVSGAGVWRAAVATTRVLRNGPVCWELEVAYQGELPFDVTTVVRLVDGSSRVEFETTIDNAASDHRLRVTFPVGDARGPVRAEGQFAVVRRPLGAVQPATEWCEPPDATQHAVGVVALGAVALLTRGLPEYEARDAELCLTLLRCVGFISRAREEIATRPVSAGPRLATPEGQCLGRHVCEYALRFDADALDDAGLLRASADYRAPFLVTPAGVEFDAPLTLEGDVVFSCLKGAQDGRGLILRVFNPGSAAATARVHGPSVAVERLRLDETGGTPVVDGRVDVGPGQIATLRVT